MTEGEHARVTDKNVDGDNQHDADQAFRDGPLKAPVAEARYQHDDDEEPRGQNEERPKALSQTSERGDADHLDAFLERSHADQPLGAEQQDQNDHEKNESVTVGS